MNTIYLMRWHIFCVAWVYMELRQLRYFVTVVDTGSISSAAKQFGLGQSALSQQLARLEGEISARLLNRTPTGVKATEAGRCFYQHAQLSLRHAETAVAAAQHARLSGQVSVGLASSVSAMVALPFVQAMQSRYPDVKVRIIGSLSSNLKSELDTRRVDMAISYAADPQDISRAIPLVEESLFLIGRNDLPELHGVSGPTVTVNQIAHIPLIHGTFGLRHVIDEAFGRHRLEPNIVLTVDGLSIIMNMVAAGFAATIQSGAATTLLPKEGITCIRISDAGTRRYTTLLSLADDEMSPAALATRIVLKEVVYDLVKGGIWPGAGLNESFNEKDGEISRHHAAVDSDLGAGYV